MSVKISVFARLCHRCREIMREPGAPQVVVDIYQRASGPPLQRYTELMTAVARAQARANRATTAKERLLQEMDRQHRIGRAALAFVDPAAALPATLKAQPTDTDKRAAIEELVEAISGHTGEAWADNLLRGEFGQKATATIQALNEYIAARNALQRAKADRAAAFAPAWDAYVRYKRLVASALGTTSRQYQRLQIRDAAAPLECGERDPHPGTPPGPGRSVVRGAPSRRQGGGAERGGAGVGGGHRCRTTLVAGRRPGSVSSGGPHTPAPPLSAPPPVSSARRPPHHAPPRAAGEPALV